jgi:hypothetical protein
MIKKKRLEWFDSGKATEALELGMISPAIFARWIQYSVYLEFRANGMGFRKSCEEASYKTKCSLSTVYRAVKFFE